jgi:anion-transporting  ArsA/GET3 family ATPase
VLEALLQKRLIFVCGKGGVGKSTVATALGLVAARRGRRTIVCELASQHQVQHAFEREGGQFEEIELAPGLYTISIDPQHAMDEYLRVKVGALGHALAGSRVFQTLAMAAPGMRELLSIGKVWELAQFQRRTRDAEPYDFVVVDAPATGHGLGSLRTPATFAEIARVGPIAHQAGRIARTIADREFTGVVAVATPEEMPVNETLWLSQALAGDGMALDAVIVNALYPARFSDEDLPDLERALAGALASEAVRCALQAAISEHARAEVQRQQVARLSGGVDAPMLELPYLFADHVGVEQLELLAEALGRGAAPRNGRAEGLRPRPRSRAARR